MNWAEFEPYVMPHVIGCPAPVLVHHAKIKTMEFCRRTLVWQKWLETVKTSKGIPFVELELDSGQQIIKIKQVHIDAKLTELLHPEQGRALALEKVESTPGVFLESANMLYVLPTPEAAVDVRVYACLTSTMTSSSFNDELAEHLSDIANGVIASIQMLPGQAFSNPNLGVVNASMFESRVKTIAAKVSRGLSAVRMGGQLNTSFF